MSIKVIENMKPWEVMRAFEEGGRVAIKASDGAWCYQTCMPLWNWGGAEYAIIDTTKPVIDWEGFSSDFFDEDRPVPIMVNQHGSMIPSNYTCKTRMLGDNVTLRGSHFYHWPGGKRPVPENVEVEVIYRHKSNHTSNAGDYEWAHGFTDLQEIIAFRLTGNVL